MHPLDDENFAAACKRLWRATWDRLNSIFPTPRAEEVPAVEADAQVIQVVESLRTSIEALLAKGVTQFSMDVQWERKDDPAIDYAFLLTPKISIKVGGGSQ